MTGRANRAVWHTYMQAAKQADIQTDGNHARLADRQTVSHTDSKRQTHTETGTYNHRYIHTS